VKKVLLVVHTKLFFQRMLEFGQIVLESGQFEPVFHLAYKSGWEQIEQDIALLKDRQFRISEATRRSTTKSVQSAKKERKVSVKETIIEAIKIPFRIFPKGLRMRLLEIRRDLLTKNIFMNFVSIRCRLFEIRQIYHVEKADIIVLSIDVPTWDTGVFIRAARIENIPTLVALSQTGPLDEASYVYSQIEALSTKRPWNYLLGMMYPQWVCRRDNKRFLMMSSGLTFVKELLGVSMPQPWIESSSHADAVLIESEAYLDRGISVGLKASNLFLTGLPFHDFLYSVQLKKEENLSRIYSLHALEPGKPIILTSLLPKYHGRDNSGPEHASYEDMVEYWMRSLSGYKQYHAILSLHPSQQYSDYAYVEKWGVKITRMPITEIMPLCHVFVTSLSSTITMAIACGVPVVNYDFVRYGNTHYDSAPGVIKVERKQEFKEALDKILNDNSYYQEIARLQQGQAKRWGMVDGQAGGRIVNVMNNLIMKN